MKTLFDYAALARLIRTLQFKLFLAALNNRVVHYRKNIGRSSGIGEDIRVSIKNCIQEAVSNINGQKKLSISNRYRLSSRNKSLHKLDGLVDQHELGELAKYLKKINGQTFINSIETKLEKSTEDHVHAALRYARLGDEQNAQMHAGIANSSCVELSRFMDKEKHLNFVRHIRKNLKPFKLIV